MQKEHSTLYTVRSVADGIEHYNDRTHSLGLARIVPAAVLLLAVVDRHDRRYFLQKEIGKRDR